MLAAAPEVGGGQRNDGTSFRFRRHALIKRTPAQKAGVQFMKGE